LELGTECKVSHVLTLITPFTSNTKTFKALLCFQGLYRSYKMDIFSRTFKKLWPIQVRDEARCMLALTWCRLSMSSPSSMSIGCSPRIENDVWRNASPICIWPVQHHHSRLSLRYQHKLVTLISVINYCHTAAEIQQGIVTEWSVRLLHSV